MNQAPPTTDSTPIQSRAQLLQAYSSEGWNTVPGWLYDGAKQLISMVDLFQKKQDIQGNLGEIGLFEGKLFILLSLMARENENCFGVDFFGVERPEDVNIETRRSRIQGHIEKHIGEHPWVDILTSDSTLVSAEQLQAGAKGKYRLFSIDGGHDTDTVYHDIKITAASLAPGGVILLDDYFDPGNPEVSVGTCKYFFKESPTIAPFLIAGNKVFLCDKDYHERYYNQFSKVAEHAIRAHTDMLGHKVIVYKI